MPPVYPYQTPNRQDNNVAVNRPASPSSTLQHQLRCQVAARAAIDPFIVMDLLARANSKAAAGQDVVHMEVGEPAGGAPGRVIEAAKRALCHRPMGYTEALGQPALRQAIARHYRQSYDLNVDPARIAITMGASGAFVLGFLAAFDVGDRVVVPEPAFPAYKNILSALGVEVVRMSLGSKTGFKPTIDMLEALEHPVQGLIIASPGNPTGTMLDGDELRSLAAYCSARGIRLISDEIYHGICYGEPAKSMLDYTSDALVINGFSKYFCMTGWRLGWVVMPEDLIRPIELLAQNLYISAPTIAQEAALRAFDCTAELDLRLEGYKRNLDLLLEALPKAGIKRFAPVDGAFYLYADVSDLTDDTSLFCRDLLDQTGVALAPGADFDAVDGHRHVRFAFCVPEDRVAFGMERLAAWIGTRN